MALFETDQEAEGKERQILVPLSACDGNHSFHIYDLQTRPASPPWFCHTALGPIARRTVTCDNDTNMNVSTQFVPLIGSLWLNQCMAFNLVFTAAFTLEKEKADWVVTPPHHHHHLNAPEVQHYVCFKQILKRELGMSWKVKSAASSWRQRLHKIQTMSGQ